MGKFRSLPVKKPVEQNMERGRRKPFFPADDVGNVHQPVVHHVGQVVGGHAVSLEEDFVVQVQGVDAYPAADAVLEFDFFVAGQFDPNDVGISGSQTTLHFLGGKGEAVFHGRAGDAVVLPVGIAAGFGALPNGLQFFGGIKGVVGMARSQQLVCVLAVHGFALRLAVRGVGTAYALAFVGRDAAPCEGFQNVFFRAGHVAGLVRVFNAQEKLPSVLLGKEVVVEGRTNASHVERAGGTGRESNANGT